jgi:hypothetical protein
VANHQFRAMRLAMRRLKKLGFQRIGLALRRSFDARVNHHWLGGFLVEQRRFLSPNQVPPLIVPDREWNSKSFAKWFHEHRPEVIISHHEEVLEWFPALEVYVPEEAGFVHLNCPDLNGTFAGIFQNAPLIGAVAVDFLAGMIQRNERGIPALSHSILVEGIWQDGATIATPVSGKASERRVLWLRLEEEDETQSNGQDRNHQSFGPAAS